MQDSPDIAFRYRFRPEPGFDFIGARVADLLGYSPEEFYADPDLDMRLVHPDDLERYQRLIVQPETGARLRWRRRDGSFVPLSITGRPVLNETADVVAVEGFASVAHTPNPDGEKPRELSEREWQVLCLICEGLTDREIGERLGISERTAGQHVGGILKKLSVPNRTAAVVKGAELALVDLKRLGRDGGNRGSRNGR